MGSPCDIFWLKDKSLTDLDDLPEPEDLAAEIIEHQRPVERIVSLHAGRQHYRVAGYQSVHRRDTDAREVNLEAGLASFRKVLDGLGQRPRQERHGLEASDCAAQLPVVGSMRARPTSGT